jgi:hypothetical protein
MLLIEAWAFKVFSLDRRIAGSASATQHAKCQGRTCASTVQCDVNIGGKLRHLTAGDEQDILVMAGAVLEAPLAPPEVNAGRARILSQFRPNPVGACKGLPLAHKAAEIVRHGSLAERTELGSELWAGWL